MPRISLSKKLFLDFPAKDYRKTILKNLIFPFPSLDRKLINFVENKGEEEYWGYVYSGLLFVLITIQSFFLQQYFARAYTEAMHVKTAVLGLVYRKVSTVLFIISPNFWVSFCGSTIFETVVCYVPSFFQEYVFKFDP